MNALTPDKCQDLHALQTFPDIDEMYKQRTLARLIEKEQWAVAATYAGQDKTCQVCYVCRL